MIDTTAIIAKLLLQRENLDTGKTLRHGRRGETA